ncbi:MAG TPA: MFS transporter [Steroidobacteraceae bacterium]
MKNPALVLMLAAVLFINYADRGLVSTAAPLLQSELHLTDPQLGLLFSAFFWTYACAQIPIGWVAERYGAGRVLAGGLLLWAVATALAGAASGLVMLVVLRMLLGIGESTGFPCVAKLLAAAMPVEELGVANGIVGAAYSFGPAMGALLGGVLMVNYGWRVAFVVFGASSLLWLWPWLRLAPRQKAINEPAPTLPMATLLRTRALWGTTLGLFCSNYVFFFTLSWLPIYLVREHGFSMGQMTSLTSASYTLMAVCALLGGLVVDRYIKRGGSPDIGYKTTMTVVNSGAVACMLAMAYGSRPLAVVGMFVYQALNGASAAGLYAMPEIFGGAAATGRWVGIQNSIGSLAGVIAPWLTGVLINFTGHFTVAFILAAAMSLLGLVGWLGLLPKVEAIDWEAREPGRAATVTVSS